MSFPASGQGGKQDTRLEKGIRILGLGPEVREVGCKVVRARELGSAFCIVLG